MLNYILISAPTPDHVSKLAQLSRNRNIRTLSTVSTLPYSLARKFYAPEFLVSFHYKHLNEQ